MDLKIFLQGNKKAQAEIHAMGARAVPILHKFLRKQALQVERTAKKEAPVDTGQVQSSLRPDITGTLRYEVKPHAKHAIFAHNGRRPGKMPPVSAVESWARRRGINPFMVARAIGRKGTKGKPFMDIAYTKQKPIFRRDAGKLLNEIVR